MCRTSVVAPACWKAKAVSASQLVPGARRIRTLGLGHRELGTRGEGLVRLLPPLNAPPLQWGGIYGNGKNLCNDKLGAREDVSDALAAFLPEPWNSPVYSAPFHRASPGKQTDGLFRRNGPFTCPTCSLFHRLA